MMKPIHKTAAVQLLLAALFLSLSSASMAGDAKAGEEKAVTCQACHGADGLGTDPTYPILAGQYEDYLAHALRAYRDGTRKNVIMYGFASTLSDEDIEDLAAYYAAKPGGVRTLEKR